MKGLFVQSNFGVLTAMRVALMPMPEHFESFVLRSNLPDALPGSWTPCACCACRVC